MYINKDSGRIIFKERYFLFVLSSWCAQIDTLNKVMMVLMAHYFGIMRK